MKQLVEAFKSARKIELMIIAACLCALALCCFGGIFPNASIATEDEKRIQRMLSKIEDAGKVELMLAAGTDGEINGALVVAQGAEKIEVLLKLQQAVHTLTGLELDQIEVVESKR